LRYAKDCGKNKNACEVFGVKKSTFYKWKNLEYSSDLVSIKKIKAEFLKLIIGNKYIHRICRKN
jgi:hypothetical protein